VTAARDALHWGPGLFNNLVFHQNAVPFNYLSYSSGIGPLKFITIYGKLSISPNDNFYPSLKDERNLYAHRYEITLSQNLLLGISEQLILYNNQDLFSFIPIVPLYITKGTQVERANNGNIAFDVSYKLFNSWHLYSEFLIDDLQAPTSLFDDFWANKWGAMVGLHKIMNFNSGKLGLVLETSRIEPWVYTHNYADEAQSAHLGYPLGNQNGPNSQNITGKLYFREYNGFYFSTTLSLDWKGNDNGSQLNDEISSEERAAPKEFIAGISKPEVIFKPYLGYARQDLSLEISSGLGAKIEPQLRIMVSY